MKPKTYSYKGIFIEWKGRFEEPKVIECIGQMLRSIDLSGVFTAKIEKKIPGSSEHRGIEVVDFTRHSKILLKVQYGDNGTRFCVYLHSPEIRTNELLELLKSRLKGQRFNMEQISVTETFAKTESASLPQLNQDESASTETKITHLVEYANDPTLRQFLLAELSEKYRADEFSSSELYKIVCTLMSGCTPTAHACGQLARRLTNAGYLQKAPDRGAVRYYRLAQGPVTVAPNLAGDIQTGPDIKETLSMIPSLESQVADLQGASRMFSEVCAEEARVGEDLAELRLKLQEIEDKLGKLRARKMQLSSIINDPVRQDALKKMNAIHAILKGGG